MGARRTLGILEYRKWQLDVAAKDRWLEGVYRAYVKASEAKRNLTSLGLHEGVLLQICNFFV